MKTRLLYYSTIISFLFFIAGYQEAYAQLSTSGSWKSGITISNKQTVNLTGNLVLNGQVTIKNKGHLTINIDDSVTDDITITYRGTASFFNIEAGGTLEITGKSSDQHIILDGGADFEFDKDAMTLKAGTTKTVTSGLTNAGNLRFTYVTIQNMYGSDANGGAFSISNAASRWTELNYCKIQYCYSQLGSAMMISGKGPVRISDSEIYACFSGGGKQGNSGGAIRTYGSTSSSLYLTRVKFLYNYAQKNSNYSNNISTGGNGGAIFWNARGTDDTECVIKGCEFAYNKSDDNGGAIKSQATLIFDEVATLIHDNTAPKGAGLYIEGYTGSVWLGSARTIDYDLGKYIKIYENKAPEYIYKEKRYPGKGAGVNFYFGKEMSLDAGSTINVNLNGAEIYSNTVGDEASSDLVNLGGGIYIENTSPADSNYVFNINLNYGKIEENVAYGNSQGGGIYVYNASALSNNIDNQKLFIRKNDSKDGAGIYINEGSLTIANGEIKENETSGSGNGGGIYIKNGNFTINAGEISGNTVSNGNGGGVYIVGSSGNGNFTMNGSGSITGNSASGNEDGAGFGGGIYVNGGNFTMTEFATEGQISSNASTKDGGGVYINGGQFIQTAGSISSNTSGGNGGGVCIVEGGTFTMSGGSIAGNGKGNDISTAKSQNGGGVYLNGGNFVLENGTISENGASENGGGVFLTGADCRYTLEQGDITENNAKYGGGVFLERGQFILGSASRTADGNISGNTAVKGGGVYIGSESDNIVPSSDEGASATLSEGFVMHGGKIENNSTSSDGGGIYLSGGNFTQNNGVIQANTSSTNGGGIYLLGGSFLQNMGTISNNKSVTNGGGICIVGGDFTMAGGSISNNGMSADRTYTQNGGGIYLQEGNFIQNDGIISGNSSTTNGGGACIEGGNFTMNGGSISENGKRGDNIETDNGGGVFLNDGKLTVTEGEIKLNTSRDYGGGIYILNGEVDMGSGVIKQNKCDFYGGGVYVFNNGGDDIPIKFEGGILNQNEAQFGGGICVNGKINLTINNIQIVNNRAINGGGVCLMNNAKMNFGTGQIIQNHAYTDENTTYSGNTGHLTGIADLKGIGGGVYLDSNTTLTFDDSDGVQLGLFGNKADNGADELFANGSGTTVNVPDVTTMKLDGFTGAGNLKWIEDYIRNDSGYLNGTNLLGYTESTEDKTVMRYKDMISMNMQHIPQLVGGIGIDDDNAKKYICFALGYEVIFITISKSGLANGESAIYTLEKMPGSSDGEIIDDSISDDEDQPNEIKFRVVLTGNGNDIIRKKVAVTAGIWRVSETGWSWTYTDNQAIEKDVTDGKNREFGFTSQKHSELPMYDEDIVFHELGGSSSQLN